MENELSLDGFTEFDKTNRYFRSDKPEITIGKDGRISLHKHAYLEYFRDSFVKFHYNKDTNIIALQIFKTKEPHTHRVIKNPKSYTGCINAKSFFKFIGISTNHRRLTKFIGTSNNGTIVYIQPLAF